MNSRRLSAFLGAGSLVVASATAACVGDDPAAAGPTGASDAGATTDAATQDAPATTTDANDGASAWTPASLGNQLVVWLEGDSNVALAAGKVATWGDKSSAGNSAIQANTTYQPIVSPVTVNGHHALRFAAGAYVTLQDATSLQWGTGGFSIGVVLAYSNVFDAGAVDSYGIIWGKQELTDPYVGVSLIANSPLSSSSGRLAGGLRKYDFAPAAAVDSAKTGLNDRAMHMAILRRTDATTLDLRVDGTGAAAQVPSLDISAPGRGVIIGSGGGTTQQLEGDIAEIVAVAKALDGSETADLEAYFKSKFGL